jgi:ubiquinone/menaquinone biosynthesis C-methylase UbiE
LLQEKGLLNHHQNPWKILHIAPEPCLADLIQKMEQVEYLSIDLYNKNAMMKMDITDISFSDESFDLIICSHVLEHIPDDRKAMRELRRILKLTGKALILVPIKSNITYEDPTIVDPLEREKFFGQVDHVRLYGPDVQNRLEEAGFKVTQLSTGDLVPANQMSRMGLKENETVYLCEVRPQAK